jgi:hypothetical protein
MGDNALREPRDRGESHEGAQLLARDGAIRAAVELALDSPEVAVVGLRKEVDALVGGWELKLQPDLVWHPAPTPDRLELGLILGLGLKVELRQALEGITLPSPLLGIVMRRELE